MEQQKVLVTGPCGLLGNNIVRELLNRNYYVRAFVHQLEVRSLDNLGIEKIHGDILVEEDVIEAAEGMDFVIHAAANTSIWPYRSKITRQVNIEGTKNILKAIKHHQINRLVSIGSATSFGSGTLKNPGNEQSSFTASKFGLDYIDSKHEAQNLILNAVQNEGLKAVILNPTFMLGAYDTKPSSGELLLALYNGKIPGYTSGGRNYVHVQDVAVAACNALTKGQIGECYIMANQNMSYKDFNELVAAELNIKAPRIFVPKPFILLYGLITEGIARLFNKTPAISLAIARISLTTNYYTSTKAIKELDMPQTPISQAIHDAFDWFKENNYLAR